MRCMSVYILIKPAKGRRYDISCLSPTIAHIHVNWENSRPRTWPYQRAQPIRFAEASQAWSGFPHPTAGSDWVKPTMTRQWLIILPRIDNFDHQSSSGGPNVPTGPISSKTLFQAMSLLSRVKEFQRPFSSTTTVAFSSPYGSVIFWLSCNHVAKP